MGSELQGQEDSRQQQNRSRALRVNEIESTDGSYPRNCESHNRQRSRVSTKFARTTWANLMGDTLRIVSLEEMWMVTELNRKSLRALEKSGRHNVPGRNQDRKSQESLTVPVCVPYLNTQPLAHVEF